MISIPEFKKILKNIPGSYDDFVNGFGSSLEDEADRKQVVQFLKEHPDATTSDVLAFYRENLWNELDDYDEDTILYDDDVDEEKCEAGFAAYKTALEGMRKHIPVRIELENGKVYPHEEVVEVDYFLRRAFFVKLSEEGAKVDPEDKDEPGDVVGFEVYDIKVELVKSR